MKNYLKIKYVIFVFIGFLILIHTANTLVFADRSLQAPSRPVNLQAVEVTESTVTLKWNKTINSSNIKRYKIYKDNTYVGSSLTSSYTLENLDPSTEYEFYVRSEAEENNVSLASEEVFVKTKGTDNKIIGYYPAWKSYSGYTPDKLDASKLTHINYAFAYIGKDNKVKQGYPDKDSDNFKKLNELKKINPDLKILISVGGWNWSGQFSDTALTESSRAVFAKSCVEFLIEHNIDGIDLDWEYPVGGGLPGNGRRPEDKQNFTLLLKEIRKKLDEQEIKDNKSYFLTIAGGASNFYLGNIEPSEIKEYLDYVNIMTYDLHGPWDAYSDFNSPLYNKSSASLQYKISVDSSVKAWLNAGFTKDKLVVGIPFYGYVYKINNDNSNGLLQKFTQGNSLSYSNIKANYINNSDYIKYFHPESQVPWLYNGETFITYDDPYSIKMKTEYILNEDLGGAMIWELSQDYKNELLNSIYEVLK